MRQDWEVKKLGDVCQIIGGGTPSKAKINFYNRHLPDENPLLASLCGVLIQIRDPL